MGNGADYYGCCASRQEETIVMGNARRIPNASSESEVRSAFQRLDSDVTILEDGTVSVDVIAAVGSLIVKDSDTTVKSYTEFSQGTNNQVLVSAGVGVIPVWTTDLDGLTLLTVDNITVNGAAITSDTGAISFGNENLTTTGTLNAGAITVTSLIIGAWTVAVPSAAGQVLIASAANTASWATAGNDKILASNVTGTVAWANKPFGYLIPANSAQYQVYAGTGVGTAAWTKNLGGLTYLQVDSITINNAMIFSSTGAISFSDDNLSTTGTLGCGAATVTSLTDGTASLSGGSLTSVKLGTLTTNGFVKTSGADGTLSIDTNTYLTAEADTLDTVADRGATTDQTLTTGGFATTGTMTAGLLTVDNITVNGAAITSDTGAISFGNENLTTSGLITAGNLTLTSNGPKLFLNDNAGGSQKDFSLSVNFSKFILRGETDAKDMNEFGRDGAGGFITILDDSEVEGTRITAGGATFRKASGFGLKVDTVVPTFPWRDLLGRVTSVNQGASKPTHTTYRDGIFEFEFAAGDEDYFQFHIPHDYAPGTDIYLHFHWSHIGTLVTGGTVTFEYEVTYAASHNQAAFPASVSGTIAGTASAVQYQQILTEVRISASAPSGSQIDSDDLEPDGLILMTAGVLANNITVSGGGVPDPFIHFIDIHYQSINIGTKDKAPDFYV